MNDSNIEPTDALLSLVFLFLFTHFLLFLFVQFAVLVLLKVGFTILDSQYSEFNIRHSRIRIHILCGSSEVEN